MSPKLMPVLLFLSVARLATVAVACSTGHAGITGSDVRAEVVAAHAAAVSVVEPEKHDRGSRASRAY